jgi:hypothetical protein
MTEYPLKCNAIVSHGKPRANLSRRLLSSSGRPQSLRGNFENDPL